MFLIKQLFYIFGFRLSRMASCYFYYYTKLLVILRQIHLNKQCIGGERNQKNNIPDHPYRTLIVNGSGSRKTNALLNLINHESDIFICKRSIRSKYQLLFNKIEHSGINFLNDTKGFIEYSNDMNDIYKKVEELQYK